MTGEKSVITGVLHFPIVSNALTGSSTRILQPKRPTSCRASNVVRIFLALLWNNLWWSNDQLWCTRCFLWNVSYEMPLMRCLQKDEASLLKADPPVTQSTLFWLKRTNEMRLKRRHFEESTSMLQDRGNKANCRFAEFIHLPQMEIGFYVLDHKVSLRTLIRWWSKFDQTIREQLWDSKENGESLKQQLRLNIKNF